MICFGLIISLFSPISWRPALSLMTKKSHPPLIYGEIDKVYAVIWFFLKQKKDNLKIFKIALKIY